MINKLLSLFVLTSLFVLGFQSCKKEESKPKEIELEKIELNQESIELSLGSTFQLKGSLFPENASDQKLSWSSSNSDIVSVSADGLLSADGIGDARIEVINHKYNITASAFVKVTPIQIIEIKLNKSELSLQVGSYEVLVATVLPDNATNQNLMWSSSDPTIATVDENGKVVGEKVGSALVTVESNDKVISTSTKVQVLPVPIEALILNKRSSSLLVDETEKISVTLEPANATPVDLVWSSANDKIAVVDQNGNVKGLEPGIVEISVNTSDGRLKETITITVIPVPVRGVTLNKAVLNLLPNDSQILQASVYPQNAANKELAWSSSDASIASVDEFGRVTAHKTGTAKITATTVDGNYSVSCNISILTPQDVIQVVVKTGPFTQVPSGLNIPILVGVYNPSNTPMKLKTIRIVVSGTPQVTYNITTVPYTRTFYHYKLGPFFFPFPINQPSLMNNWTIQTEYEMSGETFFVSKQIIPIIAQFSEISWSDFNRDFYGFDKSSDVRIQAVDLRNDQAIELK